MPQRDAQAFGTLLIFRRDLSVATIDDVSSGRKANVLVLAAPADLHNLL
jgi:hypothetical protein